MARIRISKWNVDGFEQIRRSPGVQRLVNREAKRIADNAGDGFAWSSRQGKSRFRGIVFTDTYRSRIKNSRHNTLLKAMGS